MHLKKLIKLSLITLTLLTLTACGRKEVVSVEVPTTTTETVETVKPAEPIVVSVEPINEAKEETKEDLLADTVFPADTTVDYYGKDVENQPKSTSPNTGLSVADEDSSTSSDMSEEAIKAELERKLAEEGITVDHTTLHGGSKNIFNP